MPAANKISGVGAIVTDGFDAQIQNNTIVDSYGMESWQDIIR